MSTSEAAREQQQVIGTVAEVVQTQGGKFQVRVFPDGSQNKKNIWIGEDKTQFLPYLQSQVGNRLAFVCNLSHWTRQDGQAVTSLWLELCGPPTVDSPALAGPPAQAVVPPPQQATMVHPPQHVGQPVVVQPTVEPMVAQAPREDLREKKIHRQSAAKVAAILLGYLDKDEQNLATLLSVSERLVAYFDNGMPQAETLDDLMHRAMPRGMDYSDPQAQGEGYANAPPPPGDEDIPF